MTSNQHPTNQPPTNQTTTALALFRAHTEQALRLKKKIADLQEQMQTADRCALSAAQTLAGAGIVGEYAFVYWTPQGKVRRVFASPEHEQRGRAALGDMFSFLCVPGSRQAHEFVETTSDANGVQRPVASEHPFCYADLAVAIDPRAAAAANDAAAAHASAARVLLSGNAYAVAVDMRAIMLPERTLVCATKAAATMAARFVVDMLAMHGERLGEARRRNCTAVVRPFRSDSACARTSLVWPGVALDFLDEYASDVCTHIVRNYPAVATRERDRDAK